METDGGKRLMGEDALDPVVDFHQKCSELLYVIEEENDEEAKIFIIKKYLETLEENNGIQIPNFENDEEWFNVEHPLSFTNSLSGKIVVLDFFTYCCINCMHILPDLEALESRFKDTDGLVIVGVHSAKFDNEKLSANILSAVLRYNITHPVVNDAQAKLWQALGVQCWPTLVIVNPCGRAIFAFTGETHRETLKIFIAEVIAYYEKKFKISHNAIPRKLAKDSLPETVLHFPGKLCCDDDRTMLAIADSGNHRIIITDYNGIVQTCVGGKDPGFSDGCFSYARFKSPQGVCFRNNQEIYIADTENHAIRKIDLKQHIVTTVAGTGQQGNDYQGGCLGVDQPLSSPWDVTIAKDNPNVLYIAMAGTHQIWILFLDDSSWIKNSYHKKGVCMRFAGSGIEENRNNTYPLNAGFAQPSGLAVRNAAADNTLFVADSESSTVRAVSLKDGSVKAVVGGDINPKNLFAFGDADGKGTKARLQHPLGVCVLQQQGVLLVADSYNHKIKVVNPVTRSCTTIAGSGQPGHCLGLNVNITDSVLNEPGGLAVHPNEEIIYIADTNNHCIKQLNLSFMELSELPIIFTTGNKKDVTDSIFTQERVCPYKKVILDPTEVIPGQTLKIHLHVLLPCITQFNEEAPNRWTLFTEDAELKQALSEKNCGEIKKLPSSVLCTLIVPQYTKSCTVELQADCTLFLCNEDHTCTIKTLRFVQLLKINIVEEQPIPEVAEIKLFCDLSN